MKKDQNQHEGHWFGYQPVDPNEKTSKVKAVFDSVAQNYDLMNDAMSMGIHRLWKKDFVKSLPLKAGQKILDVASGTGDIAYKMLRASPNIHVTATDINEAMLMQGKKNLQNRGIISNITYQQANAEALPFEENQFDLYTIAFGLRNVTHIDQALKEAHRVLKPGGRFFCMEFSHVEMTLVKQFYDFYSFKILPMMGQILAKDREAYQYLAESIRQFPKAPELVERMSQVGFAQSKFMTFSFGVVAVHSGWKI